MAHRLKVTLPRFLAVIVVLATALFAVPPAAASDTVTLNGSFSYLYLRPTATGLCPSGAGDACGFIQMDGFGAADWAWVSNHDFTQGENGCWYGTATFTLTLRSDDSTISGPTTAVYCPTISDNGGQHESPNSFGNPFVEDDTIQLADGTGQFAGFSGTAILHVFGAGATYKGTLTGTLSN